MFGHEDKTMPATTFPLFPSLPKEIRLKIWTYALPGPRIVYIQRYRTFSNHSSSLSTPPPMSSSNALIPQPTYFGSPSISNTHLTSLARTNSESLSVVLKHYTLIAPTPSPPTYFSPILDYLYLDFGRRYTLPYDPLHFDNIWVGDCLQDGYLTPPISPDFASQVQNLVVYNNGYRRYMGNNLAADVLKTFPGLKVLVLADQLHGREESGEELVWLRGEVGQEVEDQEGQEKRKREGKYWLFLRNLLLWRDRPVYGLSPTEEGTEYMGLVARKGKRGCAVPITVKKSITTAMVKRKLLDICRTEDNFLALEGLDWEFIMGRQDYTGSLDLTQQIRYVELALERLSTKLIDDDQGCEIEGGFVANIWDFLAKIEDLSLKREMLELIISEAEEMVWH